jgi:mRNA-degrading endonuclease toxin of MazEF toxin-antitoxin module
MRTRIPLIRSRAKLIALVAVVAIAAGTAAFGHVSVTATTYLLDRRGHVVTRYVGEPNWSELHARIERALADPA